MDTLQLIASAAGIGVLAGIRLYLTVLAVGLAVRFEWLQLGESFSQLSVLGDWRVIGFAAVASLIEFFSDKVPWLDSAWDSVHTFIRPIGAAFLTLAAFDSVDPGLRFLLILITGGAALTSHSAKAATRLAVNHSPEPFSNVALSLAGDVAVPVGVWAVMEYPLVVGTAAALFVLAMLLIAPKIYRVLRVEAIAIGSLVRSWFDAEDSKVPEISIAPGALAEDPGRLATMLASIAAPLPDKYSVRISERFGFTTPFALYGVLRRGASRGRNRVGYLCLLEDRFVFVAKTLLGWREQEFSHSDLEEIRFERGLLVDDLRMTVGGKEVTFDLFKDRSRRGERLEEAWKLCRA